MQRRSLLLGASATLFAMPPEGAWSQAGRTPKGYLRTNWSRDPFARGAYSYIAKGARRRDSARLAQPIGPRLFFAGEAAHPEYTSTVHAAMESGWIAAEALMQTRADHVAVIGAGVSGLSAAQDLWDNDYDVTVFEARPRIGGRLRTDHSLGLPLDLGASWIHGDDDNPVAEIASDLGLRTVATDTLYKTRGGDGRLMRDEESPDWVDEITTIHHTAGAAWSDLNPGAYLWDNDYDGAQLIFPDGYSRVLSSFDTDLPLRLGQEILRVASFDDHIWLTARDGTETRFDAVIVTVPLGVLKAGGISFDPPLPSDVQSAIDRLGFGLLDKLYLLFDDVFWDQDVTWIVTPENGLPPGQFNQWMNLSGYLGAPVLLGLNGGPAAHDLATLTDADVLSRAAQTLARAYPD